MLRSVASVRSSNSENLTTLKQEVVGLEELSRQLFVEAVDSHTMEEKLEWSTTWQGKYFNFLGYFFSIYCCWKIFIVSIRYLVLFLFRRMFFYRIEILTALKFLEHYKYCF